MDPFHEGLVAVFPQIRQFLSRPLEPLEPLELEGIDSARPAALNNRAADDGSGTAPAGYAQRAALILIHGRIRQ